MKTYISSALKRYNANSRNTYTGDCVRRALSLAYGLDYDKISSELNKIKRAQNTDNTGRSSVWLKFLKDHNAPRIENLDTYAGDDGILTVDEFCKSHPTGTYILSSNKKHDAAWANHLICVIDGDVYDTWDSTTSKIFSAWVISDQPTEIHEELSIENVLRELDSYAEQYLDEANKKYDVGQFGVRGLRKVNDYTGDMDFICRLPEDLPKTSRYKYRGALYYTITIKLTPRWTEQENIDSLKPKLKQKLYDWIYGIRKAFENDAIGMHKYFQGDENFLRTMPKECQPYISYASKADGYNTIFIDPMPTDKYANQRGEYRLYDMPVDELKQLLKEYAKTGNRLNYEI